MMMRLMILSLLSALVLAATPACSTREVVGGAVVGGAAYEYANKRALDNLEDDYRHGRITRQEYQRRRQQIEDRSLVY